MRQEMRRQAIMKPALKTAAGRLGVLVVACLLCCDLTAGDLAWDHLPPVGYEGEHVSLAVRPAGGIAGWTAQGDDGVVLPLTPDTTGEVLHVSVALGQLKRIILSKGEQRVGIRLVRPGEGKDLGLDAWRRFTLNGNGEKGGGELAMLVLRRLEAEADRRWAVLSLIERPLARPCAIDLAAPPVPLGEPALMAEVVAAQRLTVTGQGVLVRLDGADRWAGWKHREYRQVLAWLVADCFARGALRVVLVEPCAPSPDGPALAPLRTQVQDVSSSYRCAAVATQSLSKDAYWEISPGVLGTSFNAGGQQALTALLAPYVAKP